MKCLLLLALLLAACTSSKTVPNDDDGCVGRCGVVGGVACGDCEYGYTCNAAQFCVEITNDNVALQGDEDFYNPPDEDTAEPDCPSLSLAKFPYYLEDGTIHFCRKCDTPTEKDPQCVRNLWDAQNKKLTNDYPQYDCYPYPCDMANLKPMTKDEVYATSYYSEVAMHECDIKLTPEGWSCDGTQGSVKHFNLSEGKVGFMMDEVDVNRRYYPTDYRVFEYDAATKSYRIVGPIYMYGLAYYKGKAITFMTDFRKDLDNIDVIQSYVGYFGSDGTYRVVYNKPINYIAYTPVMNDRWVLANIQEVIDGPYFVKYAKVGEWKWTNLVKDHQERKADIQGDMISLHIVDEASGVAKGYVCDLSTHPTSIGDCQLVNREAECVYHIQFDESGAKRFVYSSIFQKSVVLVDYSQGPGKWVRSDLITEFDDTMQKAYIMSNEQFRGKVLLYRETADMGGGAFSSLACYYRLDQKKKYCMKKMDRDYVYNDGDIQYPYGDLEFEGDYFLYQKSNSTPFILRDMACYCEKEGVCPLEP